MEAMVETGIMIRALLADVTMAAMVETAEREVIVRQQNVMRSRVTAVMEVTAEIPVVTEKDLMEVKAAMDI